MSSMLAEVLENAQNKRLSKRERRLLRNSDITPNINQKQNFKLKTITPLTETQEACFQSWFSGSNLMLHGYAGTGKTFISLYLALLDVINQQDKDITSVTIVRSVVPTRDMGFLPGSAKEKSKIYEAPYVSICANLFSRGDAYEILKQKNLITFETTSFLRGLTLNNTIVIIDEVANMTFHELDTIITRLGENCRVIFSGDFKQTDFEKHADKQGLFKFMDIIKRMRAFDFIEFRQEDIVRSGLVKDYIVAKEIMEDAKNNVYTRSN